jgi:N-methylhydantoinase B
LIRNFGTPQEEELFSKTANIALDPGESVRIETPGGGGYGAPAARAQARIERDLADGKVSLEAARAAYGERAALPAASPR